ncbi:MAG: iron complex outermembrane receptor protein [Glaciecola sp.]|jgi:iron complex outermembrane receptor protein
MHMLSEVIKYKRLLLTTSIVTALGGAAPNTLAQSEAAKVNEQAVEKIMVLGSNIRKIDSESAAPVQYIDRSSIELTSVGTISDLIINLPANAGSVVHPVAGANIGSSNFNIRNLGSGSTLVLINGRRAGKSPLGDSLGNQFYDLNQLPLSMVRSVDVQTDGASAIYGSEAVAGVVNIVTRKGFEGFEVSARREDASNETNTINFAFGSNSDRGSFALYATAYNASMNYRSDLDFIVERSGGSLLSTSGSPDEYITLNPLTNQVGPTSGKVIDPYCVEAEGIVSGGHCRYNFFDNTSPIPKNKRFSLFAEFDYDLGEIFGFDGAKVFGEVGYADNKATRAFGPQVNGNGSYGSRFLIPSSHPFNFFVEGVEGLEYIDPFTSEGAEFWQNNPSAAANLTTSGSFRPIGQAIGSKNSAGIDILNTSARQMIGVDADRDNWNISAWYQNYEHENTNLDSGRSIASALQAGLMDGSFNPFGIAYAYPDFVSPKNGVTTAGHDIQRYLDEIAFTEVTALTSSQKTIDLVISNSELFDLSAGYVGVAFGYQKRQETFTATPDKLTNAGLGHLASGGAAVVDGKTDVDSIFAELAVPVTEDLELQLALRYEDHGDKIGTTTDPKIAALWKLTDEVLVRASYGSSFQAPSAIQTGGIAGSAGVDFQVTNGRVTCNDPNSTTADYNSRTAAKVAGPLSPQSADNINLGIVWQPGNKSNLSLDYWRYDYSGLIVNLQSAQSVLDNDCDDGILNDTNITRGSDGVPLFIATSLENADSAITDGIDAKFSYGLSNDLGEFDFALTLSYVLSFDAVLDGIKTEVAGKRNANTDSFGAMPKLTGNFSAKWSVDNHQAVMTLRYKDSYLQDDAARSNKLLGQNIDSFTTVDMQYRYDSSELLGTQSWITLGANNITDEAPPEYGARPFFDDEVHPIRGRVLYAEVGFTF